MSELTQHIKMHNKLGVIPSNFSTGQGAFNLIVVGDSIANLGADDDEDTAFILFANALLMQRFNLINEGVSSDTTTLTLARYSADVLSQKGDIVMYCGTNDPGAGISAATTIANIKIMADLAISQGRKFFYCLIMPTKVNDDVDSAGDDRRLHGNTVNSWARTYAGTKDGLYIADTEGALTDPATGADISAYTSDGIHPNIKGIGYVAQPLVEVLDAIYPQRDTGAWSPLDPFNLVSSIISNGTGNNADGVNGYTLVTGVTGTGPNGWTCAKRNTGSGVTSGDIAQTLPVWSSNKMGRMVFTGAANGDGAGFHIGGDETLAKGRWDQGWAASTAQTYGEKRIALTGGDTGYIYMCIVPGTTAAGGSEPTWANHVTEGELFVDGTVTWMTVLKPIEGDQIVGEVDLELASLTGEVSFRVSLTLFDGGTPYAVKAINYDINAVAMFDTIPPKIRLRTTPLTVPALSGTIRYVIMKVIAYGVGVSGVQMDLSRVKVYKL